MIIQKLKEKHLNLISENLKLSNLELNKEFDANQHSKISIQFAIECLEELLKSDGKYFYDSIKNKINEIKQCNQNQ